MIMIDRMKKWGMAGVFLLACSGAALAMDGGKGETPCPMPGGHEKMGKEMGNEMDAKLGLSDEQRTKMKALREEMKAKQEALRTQVKAKREDLRQVLDSASPDRAKAEVLVNEIAALEKQMAQNHVDQVFKVREVLTPEQFQKMREFHEKNKGKHKEMWEKRKQEHSGHKMDSTSETK